MINYSKGGQVSPYPTPQYQPPQYSQPAQYSPPVSPKLEADIGSIKNDVSQIFNMLRQQTPTSPYTVGSPMPQQLPPSPPQPSYRPPSPPQQPSYRPPQQPSYRPPPQRPMYRPPSPQQFYPYQKATFGQMTGATKLIIALLVIISIGLVYYAIVTKPEDSVIPSLLGDREWGLSWQIIGGIFSGLFILAYLTKNPELFMGMLISLIPLIAKVVDLVKAGSWCDIIDVATGLFPLPVIGSLKTIKWVFYNVILKLLNMIPGFEEISTIVSTATSPIIKPIMEIIPCV